MNDQFPTAADMARYLDWMRDGEQETEDEMERTVKCLVCGRAYRRYSHYAGDQSTCQQCQQAARAAAAKPDTPQQIKRREGAWR